MRDSHIVSQNSVGTSWLLAVVVVGIILWALPVGATDTVVPWECTGFAGEAQSRCIRTFSELQQEKISKLEKNLEVQQRKVQQLQKRVARQASASADLTRQLTRKRSRWYGSPSVQIYPPLGLTFRFGRDRFFGRSFFYGKPYHYGPRFYGHGYRRWHRY